MEILFEDINTLLQDDSYSKEQLKIMTQFKNMFERLNLSDTEILEHTNYIIKKELPEEVLELLSTSLKFYTWMRNNKPREDIITLYLISTNDDFVFNVNDKNNFDIDKYLNGNKLDDIFTVYKIYKAEEQSGERGLASSRLHTRNNVLKRDLIKKYEDEEAQVSNNTTEKQKQTDKNITTYEQLFNDFPYLKIPNGVKLNKSELNVRNNYIKKVAQLALSGDNWGLDLFNTLFKDTNYTWKKSLPKSVPSQEIMEIIVDNIQSDTLTTKDLPFLKEKKFYSVSTNDYRNYLRTYKKLRQSISSDKAVQLMKDENGNLYNSQRKIAGVNTKDTISSKVFNKALADNNIAMDDNTRETTLKIINSLL